MKRIIAVLALVLAGAFCSCGYCADGEKSLVITNVTTNSPVTAGQDLVVSVELATGQKATKLWVCGTRSAAHGLDAWFADEVVVGASGGNQPALEALTVRIPTHADLASDGYALTVGVANWNQQCAYRSGVTRIFFAAIDNAHRPGPPPADLRVRFENQQLYVDDQPFFLHGYFCLSKRFEGHMAAGPLDIDLAAVRRHRFNTVVFEYLPDLRTHIKDVEKLGLMAIPFYLNDPAMAGRLRSESAILAWNVGDDLYDRDKIAKVRNVAEVIRKIDSRQKRPIMLDAPMFHKEYASFTDLMGGYVYPLNQHPHTSSIAKYKTYLEHERERSGWEHWFWTWIQAHTKGVYTQDVLGLGGEISWAPSRVPEPCQLRLMTYTAIAAGCKGVVLFNIGYFRDDWHGKDRFAQAGIMGCELDVLGPYLAEGDLDRDAGVRFNCPGGQVDASYLRFGDSAMVILLRLADNYHYQMDAARFEPDSLPEEIRLPTSTQRAYLVAFPAVRELSVVPGAGPGAKSTVQIPEFSTAAVILLTNDPGLAATVSERIKSLLPDAAGFAVTELEGKQAKVDFIQEQLSALGVDTPAPLKSMLLRARAGLQAASGLLQQGDHAGAWNAAQQALQRYQDAQYSQWIKAWEDPDKDPDDTLNYYLLPRYHRAKRRWREAVRGGNLLENASFEDGTDAEIAAWPGKGRRVAAAARTGRHSLELVSDAPNVYVDGSTYDWVTVSVESPKTTVQLGDRIDASVWVKIDEALAKTERGAILNVVGYDADGKGVWFWQSGWIEYCVADATGGWRELRVSKVVRPAIHRKGLATVSFRLGICGVGRCRFDDAELTVTRPASENE